VTPEPAPATERQLASAALFQGRREIIIVHHGQEYRLRITRADKLILTK
jgi:hemin uptake protein HemP